MIIGVPSPTCGAGEEHLPGPGHGVDNNLGLGASADSAGLTNSLDTLDSSGSIFLNLINKQ
eukprot:CAMPEP_0170119698 /NCGR_PEP_ID=MMETSP0020_2-20130122/14592_1 /TAXON_ID=98059 /ORGANISM="Dinobryon sp., Strain UTEXLB2267" /LENGTH=60 /DNA_ID=CAMNT_0010349201 /DNA_START=2695 /DNA_END=2874 /DNA_ORIENTATION=-